MPRFPGRVGNWPLRDHAHLFFPRQRKGQIDCFLVGNADGSLQGIERAAFHGEVGRATVPAVTDVSGIAPLARRLERVNHFALAQG